MRILTKLVNLTNDQRYQVSKWFTNPLLPKRLPGHVIARQVLDARTWNKDALMNAMWLQETANNNRAYAKDGLVTQTYSTEGRWYFLAHSLTMSVVVTLAEDRLALEYLGFVGSHSELVQWLQGMGMTPEQFQGTLHDVDDSIPPHLTWLESEYEHAVKLSEAGDFSQLSKLIVEYTENRLTNKGCTKCQELAFENFAIRYPKLASTYAEKQTNLRNAQNSIQHITALVHSLSGAPGAAVEE